MRLSTYDFVIILYLVITTNLNHESQNLNVRFLIVVLIYSHFKKKFKI